MPCLRLSSRLDTITILVLLLPVLLLPCRATAATEDDLLVPIHVAAGTNLIHLARDYCYDRGAWKTIARINTLTEPYIIYRETSLQVPLSLLIAEKLTATIASVHGPVTLFIDEEHSTPLHKGDRLAPGQTVVTGTDGYTHLILPDNTYTRIEPDSRFTLNYLFRLADGNIKADFFLKKGKIVHRVQQKLRPNESFRTRTPIAITGIRGTEFRLKMTEHTTNTVETLQGRVEVEGSGRKIAVGPGQGVRVTEGRPPEPPGSCPILRQHLGLKRYTAPCRC